MTSRNSSRTLFAGASALALAFASTILIAAPAHAASFDVTTSADAGPGSLRQAILDANTNGQADVITLQSDVTVTADLPGITEDLEIVGNTYTIDTDAPGYLIFHDTGAAANINLTFTGVKVAGIITANGVYTQNSSVTITNSEFDTAQVDIIGTDLTVTVTGSQFDNADNDGFQLSVYGASTASVSTSSADDNIQDGFDLNVEGSSTLSFTNSTASGNGDNGVEIVAEHSTSATISGITSNDNGDFIDEDGSGIEVDTEDDATAIVTNISVNGNADEGLDATAEDNSSITVSDSDASANGDDGFDGDTDDADSSITFTNCVSNDNGSAGFDFSLDDGSITGSNLSATGNINDGGLDAGGFGPGTVTVSDSTFNGTTDGPGVHLDPSNGGTVTLQRITANGNLGGDGGIHIENEDESGDTNRVNIIDSTMDNNEGSGLVISHEDPTFTDGSFDIVVQGSTMSRNTAVFGGGIFAQLINDTTLTVTNSTVSGNNANVVGGISVEDDSGAGSVLVVIENSTIVNNQSNVEGPGGLGILDTSYRVDHSIIADNSQDGTAWDMAAASGATGTVDYSLIQVSNGSTVAVVDAGTGNLKNMGAQLGALANNGGATLTHLPQDSSPIIGAGNPAIAGAPATDQRGQTRIVDTIDLGAVELQPALAATGVDATLLIAGGGTMLGAGALLLLLRRRHLKSQP